MLKIKKLTATTDSEPLLKNINLEFKTGEIHAIVGPKNSGKSALAHAITGHPGIDIESGEIIFNRKKIQNIPVDQRFKQGIYISFQYPPEFESTTNWELTKEFFSVSEEQSSDLKLKYESCCEILDLGLAHGERTPSISTMDMSQAKRNELIFMILSNPKFIILDEIDDGLNDEEVVLVGTIVKQFLDQTDKGCLLITHNQKLLEILGPTHVHVMVEGEIKLSGGTELYKRVIEDGYPEFS